LLLVGLYRTKNRVVTKETIAEHLWGDYIEHGRLPFDFVYAHIEKPCVTKLPGKRPYKKPIKTCLRLRTITFEERPKVI